MASNSTTGTASLDSERTDLRPLPPVVDWVLGILLVLAGLAGTLAGAAVLAAIDRGEIREAVADGTIQSDVVADADLVDVTHTTLTWVGGGLIVAGLVAVVAGVAYVIVRRRTHRRAAAGEAVSNFGANAFVGAVVSIVTSFLPFSPAVGGAVAGYLEGGGTERALGVGALSGILATAPLLAVMAFAMSGVSAGLVGVGEGALALLVAATLLLSLAVVATMGAGLGALGSFVEWKLLEEDEDEGEIAG